MGSLKEIAATAAPILLAAMGLCLTFWPPARAVSKWIWAGASAIVGTIAVSAEFVDRNSREKEIISQITGGDSFCHIDVTFTARDAITFALGHSGTFTVPDVTVQLQDSADVVKLLEEAKAGNTQLLADAVAITKLSTKTIFQGTVNPYSFIFLLTVRYTGEGRNFLIYIAAHNGLYIQRITVTRGSDGKDVVDNHLFKSVNGKDVEIWHQ
jgi:hypothetical protein